MEQLEKEAAKRNINGDKWIIRWNEHVADTYLYGSEISYEEDGVRFHNELMPPGTVIKKWQSMTNYQMSRVEPSLPIIDCEADYILTTSIECPKDQNYLIRVVFFDRYGNEAGSVIVRDVEARFSCPVKTFKYEVQLISAGLTDLVFHWMSIKEIEREY